MNKRGLMGMICLGLVLFAGAFAAGRFSVKKQIDPFTREGGRGSQYRLGQAGFVNPLLYCETVDKEETVVEFRPLEQMILAVVDGAKKSGRANNVSVYFRGLNSGRWVGVAETEKYTGASLMKLPFLMAYLKLAEQEPSLLGKTVLYDGSFNESKDQNIRTGAPLEKGHAYTIAELLYRMVVHSGNNSTVLLAQQIDLHVVQNIYQDLNVPVELDANKDQVISARDYSYFFRVLYNASYLSHSMSDQALSLLAETAFEDGLRAGVPKEIQVAHKFGERQVLSMDGSVEEVELHDCGIVYHKRHPYFLCIMTSGKALESLKGVIRELSQDIYTVVDRDYVVR